MSDQIKITLLNAGDVIEADDSWRVSSLKRDNLAPYILVRPTHLVISQNFKDIADPATAPRYSLEGKDHYDRVLAVDMDGPVAEEGSKYMIGNQWVTLSDLLAQEEISVRGKKFLVTDVVQGRDLSGRSYNGPRVVTARELTEGNHIKRQGLTVQFEQTAHFCRGGDRVFQVDVVGRREPGFKSFKPL